MVRARLRFLASGHFDALTTSVASKVVSLGPAQGGLVDLGTGTGHYLGHSASALDEVTGSRVGAVGLDLSKPAAAAAARAFPSRLFAVADIEERLPLKTACAHVALSVFAPRPGPELKRVVRDGGSLIVIAATDRHLSALRSRYGLLGVRGRKVEELRQRLWPEYALVEDETLEYPIKLSAREAADAVAMGPSAWHGTTQLHPHEPVRDQVSVVLAHFQRQPRLMP